MVLTVGTRVRSTEDHPGEVGEVRREIEGGYLIEWSAPASKDLPYGAINLERWSFADAEKLEVIA